MGRTAGDARERFAPGFGALFEPDVVTAHQWHSRSWLSDMPEGRLVLAVFEDAIRTVQRDPKGAPGRDAARWFAADVDDGSAFSFVRCCGYLGWDPKAVRHALREGRGVPPGPRQVPRERRRAAHGMGA